MNTTKTVVRGAILKHGPKSSCKSVRRIEVEVVITYTHHSATPPGYYTYKPAYTTSRESYSAFDRTCRDCKREMIFTPIKAVKNDTPCGSRCLASKGPSCECSCGGANHGRNHG